MSNTDKIEINNTLIEVDKHQPSNHDDYESMGMEIYLNQKSHIESGSWINDKIEKFNLEHGEFEYENWLSNQILDGKLESLYR